MTIFKDCYDQKQSVESWNDSATALQNTGGENMTDAREQYDDCGEWSEDVAWVVKDSKWFHIDKQGNPLYNEKHDWVGSFSEGVAWVVKDSKWFHIDKQGNPLYNERYDSAESFREGVALVMRDGKWFHINKNGKKVKQ